MFGPFRSRLPSVLRLLAPFFSFPSIPPALNNNLRRILWLVVTIITPELMPPAAHAQFTAITNGPLVTEHGDSTGCAWGDYDGDGLPDEWEATHGFSATNANDAHFDTDGDGATNADEYLAGTDPLNPSDSLRLECVRANDLERWMVRFHAVSNRTYTLMGRGGFGLDDAWRPVADLLAAPTNRRLELVHPFSDSTNQQFFRLLTPRSR